MRFIEVRKGDEALIEELSSLATKIVREHYEPILGTVQNEYMLEKFQSVKAIKGQLEDGYLYYLLDDEGYLGFAGFYPREEDLYLSKLYLLKEERGKGYGKALMDFVVSKAEEYGKDSVVLNVNRYNDGSIAFYERYGFTRIREEDNDIGHGYFMNDYVYRYKV